MSIFQRRAYQAPSRNSGETPARKLCSRPKRLSKKSRPPSRAAFPKEKALALMLAGTGLTYRVTAQGAIVIHSTIRLLEKTSPGTSRQTVPEDSSSKDTETQGKNDLDEITVTGTHIRGTKDSPSPVLVFTRSDIDAAGVNTIQQFLQSLPQNFGGASENTIGQIAAKSQTNNTVNGSAPNLRGLGADATLVLINGHRVAPGNGDGSFVDISMIPLTAIDRIEIVTDGASAIYGPMPWAVSSTSSCVEIRWCGKLALSTDRSASGSTHDVQVGQTVGDEWTGGSAVLSYQYFDQTPLSAASRDYLQSYRCRSICFPNKCSRRRSPTSTRKSPLASTYTAMPSTRIDRLIRADSTAIPIRLFTDSEPSQIDSYGASLGSTIKLASPK